MKRIEETAVYARAFEQYLKKGTTISEGIENTLKQTTHYIWRTVGDDKVRVSHKQNNGKIFAYKELLSTNHPGEDYGCRCWAEPYIPGKSEYIYQELISEVNDAKEKWGSRDLARHAFNSEDVKIALLQRMGGNRSSIWGLIYLTLSPFTNEYVKDVTLSEIGHLQEIINYYGYYASKDKTDKVKGAFNRINNAIINKAREVKNGELTYDFSNSYNFQKVCFAHGGSVVSGNFRGYVAEIKGMLVIEGVIDYSFSDLYTDPLDLRQFFIGTSKPDKVREFVRKVTDLGGKPYKITDQWQTKLRGEVKANKENSEYKE